MDINYTQIKLKNENEIFLREKHEVSIIVLDSQNLIQGKTFKNEDDKIKNFINEQMKFKDKGLFYDYIITKKGNVYKCTPDEKASTVLNFRHYSEEASILLPKYCDQTDGDLFYRCNTPDQVAVTICIESDEEDPSVTTNSGNINDFEKDTLEDILAYYIRKDETIDAKKVINRCFFPKDNNSKQYIGHMYYKNNIVKLMIEVAIATRCKAINRSIETIEFSKINTIEL